MLSKGVEMMIVSAIKAAGINPDEVMDKANQLINNINCELDNFGKTLNSIDKRLANIEQELNIAPPVINENQIELPLKENENE